MRWWFFEADYVEVRFGSTEPRMNGLGSLDHQHVQSADLLIR
jgi:hypothetical protein